MEKITKIWNKNFILLFITNLLVLAAFYASIPIIPVYCQQIGITGSKVGIVLTAMSVATILFRPIAGYLLDNFNRYLIYVLFLALFCLSFPSFILFPMFAALIVIRLYMGAVYSVCGSATMTLASDVLPPSKITEGISRFAFTISIGMAVGPFVGIQVQNYLSSKASFLTVFAITVVALICVLCCKIKYPKVERKKFALKDTIYKPAFPFMFNMMFLMIPYGAVIAYSSILAGEKNLTGFLPYFYIFLVVGMLLSKLSTQKMIDAGKHKVLVYISLLILILTMVSYKFLNTGIHLLLAGFFFGLGYGILQPLFQSFVTGTTPAPKRGVANATYLLSYDIGIGSLLMGFMQESIGLSNGFALTVVAYVVGFIIYMLYVDKYYEKFKNKEGSKKEHKGFLSEYMEHEIYTINENKTVRDAITFFTEKNISGAPIISETGKPVGYITDGDIMRYMKVDEHHPTAIDSSIMFMDYFWNTDNEFEEKLNSIMDLNVLEIGTNKPITIDINASMEEALKLLSETGIKKIPVIKDNKIVGIISRSVVTQFLVKRYLVKQYLKNKKKEEIV
ncbi:MFS transporter [Anaerofustis sp. NSJ-163]|uniref:MFS transporter n=1 Tax=Anaerofustis sp. NSJ-163 TaxID=2944391 RepID=UPI00209C6175|nr:MFS transporter [Anaerofustis sp. NSJ-163]MCO8194773.1 MFS transporter [Anaerofustis sp. NSJ-163]